MTLIHLLFITLFQFPALAELPPPVEPIEEESSKISAPADSLSAYEKLSPEDKEILSRGEINQSQHLAGGLLGTFVGFGSGHIAYEMYGSRGWIFTLGETGFLVLAIAGATGINNDCVYDRNGFRTCQDTSGSRGSLVAGVLGYMGLRLWEIIDVWTIPGLRNNEVRRVRQKLGQNLTQAEWSIYPTFKTASGHMPSSTGLEFSLNF